MSYVDHLKQLHDSELYQDLKQLVCFSDTETPFISE